MMQAVAILMAITAAGPGYDNGTLSQRQSDYQNSAAAQATQQNWNGLPSAAYHQKMMDRNARSRVPPAAAVTIDGPAGGVRRALYEDVEPGNGRVEAAQYQGGMYVPVGSAGRTDASSDGGRPQAITDITTDEVVEAQPDYLPPSLDGLPESASTSVKAKTLETAPRPGNYESSGRTYVPYPVERPETTNPRDARRPRPYERTQRSPHEAPRRPANDVPAAESRMPRDHTSYSTREVSEPAGRIRTEPVRTATAPPDPYSTMPAAVDAPASANPASGMTPEPAYGPQNGIDPPRSGGGYFLTLMALFASIGMNLYLGWIAWDTYNRYQDLVSDMRYSSNRRERDDREVKRAYADRRLADSGAY